jgi:hypothetical protein
MRMMRNLSEDSVRMEGDNKEDGPKVMGGIVFSATFLFGLQDKGATHHFMNERVVALHTVHFLNGYSVDVPG